MPGHTYQARATAIDGAGNAQDATIRVRARRPRRRRRRSCCRADPVAPVLHGVSLDVTPLSVSPTAKSVIFFLDDGAAPMATMTLAPFQTHVVTLVLPLGAHTVRAIATDALGQTGEDVLAFELVENPNEPIVVVRRRSRTARACSPARRSS